MYHFGLFIYSNEIHLVRFLKRLQTLRFVHLFVFKQAGKFSLRKLSVVSDSFVLLFLYAFKRKWHIVFGIIWILIIIIIIIYLTAPNGPSPGGSGYNTCI
jgi:hypothetical protein